MHPRVGDTMEKNAPARGRHDGKECRRALVPTEKRIIGTVQWVIEQYGIDPDRVYLCGNSMGGSGALGIGLRHGDLFAAQDSTP